MLDRKRNKLFNIKKKNIYVSNNQLINEKAYGHTPVIE